VYEEKTREELIEMLQEGNKELFDLLEGIDESQMEIPGVQGERSIKLLLAHITNWNKHGISWLESVYKGETPVMPVKGEKMDDIRVELAEQNAEVDERTRDRPLKEVVEEYKKTFAAVIEHVNILEEKHLESVFDYLWVKDPVTGRTVVLWRYWHQQEHTKAIAEWLEKTR
jgi:hypothetical protein